ncbi:MAG: MT-A70 family methyltransferase, partial [Phycisphaerae bacterium]
MSKSNGQLAHFMKAKRELALVTRIDEVKEIRDKAEALRAYSKQAGESLEMQNDCAEIKIRAERRAGELLQEMHKNGGGRPTKTRNTMLQVSGPTLLELGVTRMQSSRWQTIAAIPERAFEKHVEETRARAKTGDTGAELTTVGVLRLAKIQRGKQRRRKYGSKRYKATPLSALPTNHYGTIYADPPWPYKNQATRAAAINHYPSMSIEEICRLPVADRVQKKAHLWLWVTNSFMREAFEVIDAWGFEFKSLVVWIKPNLGLGNFVRSSHELLTIS